MRPPGVPALGLAFIPVVPGRTLGEAALAAAPPLPRLALADRPALPDQDTAYSPLVLVGFQTPAFRASLLEAPAAGLSAQQDQAIRQGSGRDFKLVNDALHCGGYRSGADAEAHLRHNCGTNGGTCGSPVLVVRDGTVLLVALHSRSVARDVNGLHNVAHLLWPCRHPQLAALLQHQAC